MHPTIHEYLARARTADLQRPATVAASWPAPPARPAARPRTSAATACAGSRPLRPAGSSPR
jgi:hypothetical protein